MATRGRKRTETATAKKSQAGVVEIRMKNPKRTGSVTVRDYTGPDGELREFKDKYGKQRVRKYTRAVVRLDLLNENDLLEFEHVKDHPIYVNGPTPILEIVDVEKKAEEHIAQKDLEAEVNYLIKKLGGHELKSFARILGVNVATNSDNVIKRFIYDIAEEDPDHVIEEYNHPDRSLKELLHAGREQGTFTMKNGVWYFNTTPMGSSFDQALVWLKENEDLHPTLRKQIFDA